MQLYLRRHMTPCRCDMRSRQIYTHDPPRRGNFAEVLARDAVYVFLRTLGDDRILVVLNGSDKLKTFAMPIGERAWRSLEVEELIGGGIAKRAGSETPVEVQAFGVRILRIR